jgi:hypothetical protein
MKKTVVSNLKMEKIRLTPFRKEMGYLKLKRPLYGTVCQISLHRLPSLTAHLLQGKKWHEAGWMNEGSS